MSRQPRTTRSKAPLFVSAVLTIALHGVSAYPQHSHENVEAPSGSSSWAALTDGMQTMHRTISSIHSSGDDDEDFVRLMLPHHEAALAMSRVELTRGTNPQMRRLAQEIVADQQSEIELMQLWLKQHHASHSQVGLSAGKE